MVRSPACSWCRDFSCEGLFSAKRVEDFILNAIDLFHYDNLNSMQVIYGTSLR